MLATNMMAIGVNSVYGKKYVLSKPRYIKIVQIVSFFRSSKQKKDYTFIIDQVRIIVVESTHK